MLFSIPFAIPFAMLFTADTHAALASGTVRVTFRSWSRPQVRVGGTYKLGGTGTGLVVDRLAQVRLGDVGAPEARAAGFADREALLRLLGRGGRPVGDDTLVWRVDFHPVRLPPPPGDQDAPSPAALAALVARLDRLDRPAGGRHQPWTRRTLRLIAVRPGVVSTELAADLGRERFSLKGDVAKLKRLGLTRSLRVGYELSPLGRALLAHLESTGREGEGRAQG